VRPYKARNQPRAGDGIIDSRIQIELLAAGLQAALPSPVRKKPVPLHPSRIGASIRAALPRNIVGQLLGRMNCLHRQTRYGPHVVIVR
jgi:hypothetical protein